MSAGAASCYKLCRWACRAVFRECCQAGHGRTRATRSMAPMPAARLQVITKLLYLLNQGEVFTKVRLRLVFQVSVLHLAAKDLALMLSMSLRKMSNCFRGCRRSRNISSS